MPRNGAIHVHVLWDRWKDCRESERSELIHDAYKEVRGADVADKIILAIGLTRPEAVRMGLLPFQLVPRIHKADTLTPKQYARAMIQEGAFANDDSEKPQLRFGSLEEAEACQERLEQRLPGSHWTIVQDLGGE